MARACCDFRSCLSGPPTRHFTSCSLAMAWPFPGTASVAGGVWDKRTSVGPCSGGTTHPLPHIGLNSGRQRGGQCRWDPSRDPLGARAVGGGRAWRSSSLWSGPVLPSSRVPRVCALARKLEPPSGEWKRNFIPLGWRRELAGGCARDPHPHPSREQRRQAGCLCSPLSFAQVEAGERSTGQGQLR